MQSEGAVLSKAVREQASLQKPLESVAASASVAAAAPQTNLDSAKAAKNSLSGIVSICYPLPAWYWPYSDGFTSYLYY